MDHRRRISARSSECDHAFNRGELRQIGDRLIRKKRICNRQILTLQSVHSKKNQDSFCEDLPSDTGRDLTARTDNGIAHIANRPSFSRDHQRTSAHVLVIPLATYCRRTSRRVLYLCNVGLPAPGTSQYHSRADRHALQNRSRYKAPKSFPSSQFVCLIRNGGSSAWPS